MSKRIWISKKEWATNPSIENCKSKIDVPPESLSLHPADYFYLDVEADIKKKKAVKVDKFWDWIFDHTSLVYFILIMMSVIGVAMMFRAWKYI